MQKWCHILPEWRAQPWRSPQESRDKSETTALVHGGWKWEGNGREAGVPASPTSM